MNFQQEKSTARTASEKAGQILKQKFEHEGMIEVEKKSEREIVTSADFEAEKAIISEIEERFPKHNILSEESGDSKKESSYLWVVDPLDGTTNFSLKSPFFAVSIALFYQKEPVLALVHAPITGEDFFAQKGKGAYLNERRIKVSQTTALNKAKLAFCHGREDSDLDRIGRIFADLKSAIQLFRQFGAASLESAFVAAGRIDGFMVPGVNVWDVAAGALLVREAGGKVTDLQGANWNLNSKSVLMSNGKFHRSLVEEVS